MTNRRDFIKNVSLTGIATSTLPVSGLLTLDKKKLNILILGGTGFLGPHTVNAALAQGHRVTLFNRGQTDPELFTDLEQIHGDRNSSDIELLAGRQWDLVIDTSAYFPRSIDLAMSVLKKNIQHYILISTISVYANWEKPGMDESAPLGQLNNNKTETVTGETYGPLKALCEQAAEKHLPGRVCTIRPGLIVGPRDKTDRFTYWPVRINRGGEVLAPGNGGDFIQFIDVRDLAEWIIHCAENQLNGIFNAQTRGGDITISQLLNSCVKTLNPAANLVWVASEFLEQHQVIPWQELPVWIPAKGDYAGSGLMSSKRAYDNGLGQRPLQQIIQDCFLWFSQLPLERQAKLRAGISAEKERKVLRAWKISQKD